jgi:hypothetical protein
MTISELRFSMPIDDPNERNARSEQLHKVAEKWATMTDGDVRLAQLLQAQAAKEGEFARLLDNQGRIDEAFEARLRELQLLQRAEEMMRAARDALRIEATVELEEAEGTLELDNVESEPPHLKAIPPKRRDSASTEAPVEQLPNDQVLALADSKMNEVQETELSDLLARQREGTLDRTSRVRLTELMDIYRHGMVRKAQAIQVAVERGLRSPLNSHP